MTTNKCEQVADIYPVNDESPVIPMSLNDVAFLVLVNPLKHIISFPYTIQIVSIVSKCRKKGCVSLRIVSFLPCLFVSLFGSQYVTSEYVTLRNYVKKLTLRTVPQTTETCQSPALKLPLDAVKPRSQLGTGDRRRAADCTTDCNGALTKGHVMYTGRVNGPKRTETKCH